MLLVSHNRWLPTPEPLSYITVTDNSDKTSPPTNPHTTYKGNNTILGQGLNAAVVHKYMVSGGVSQCILILF